MEQIDSNAEEREKSPEYHSNNRTEEVINNDIVLSIREEIERLTSYTPKVAVFGDTGVGKSSLCNALFGKEVAKVSDVTACTREAQRIELEGGAHGIVLYDVPGVGEDPAHHNEYKQLYKDMLPGLDLVIWAIKADDRKYSTAIDVYQEILKPHLEDCPVIFAITQADKIEPHREWDVEKNKPGDTQAKHLYDKEQDISARFDVGINKVISVSASDSWNLVELVNRIVSILPNEKKYSFAREAKEEYVSEETETAAGRGIWDYLRDKFEDVWSSARDDIVDTIASVGKAHGVRAIKWLARRIKVLS